MSDDIVKEEEQEQAEDIASDAFPEVDTSEVMQNIKLKEEVSDKEVLPEEKPLVVSSNADVDPATMELYNEFSEFLVKKADIIENLGVRDFIPTGIDILDAMLGGGLPVGALSIIVGAPGSGKSMLAIQTMAGGQKAYQGLIAAYLDSEEATSVVRLSNLGVKNPRIKPITDVTVEKVFKLLETMCVFKEEKKLKIPSMVVWDSIANTLTMKEREVDDINSVIGYKARVLSILVPKYVAKISQYNIAWVAVNQLRDSLSIGPYSAPKELRFMSTGKSMPGGTVLKYNAHTLLEMKVKAALDPEKIGFDGILVGLKSVKCKEFPPNVDIELVGNFVTGFNNFRTNYHFLAKNKRMTTGAWNSLKDYPEKKFRTKDAEILYDEDPKFKEEWDKAVKEAINVEIIQKYNPVI